VIRVANPPAEVVIRTIILPEQQEGRVVLQELLADIGSVVGDLSIISKDVLPDYSDSYLATVRCDGKVGVVLLFLSGPNGFVAGMFDEEARYDEAVKDMARIVESFEYDEDLKDVTKVGATEMELWTDPTEGAFTIRLPQGWDVSGDSGITRLYLDAAVKIKATKDDMGISIEQLHPPLYIAPNWVLEMGGFTEGSNYMGMIVRSHHTAREYIVNILAQELGFGAPAQVTERPGLVPEIYQPPWIQQVTAAEATFVEAKDRKENTHNVLVVDEYYELAGTAMWAVSLLHYWAPTGEVVKVANIADEMMRSFKLNESWAKREQQEVAKRVGIISETGNEIAGIIESTFEYRDRVLDETSHRFSNAILGIEDVYDPETGEHWSVPNDAKRYWNYFNTIIGTETESPPIHDPNIRPLYCPHCE